MEDGIDRAKTKAHLAYEVTSITEIKAHLKKHAIEFKDSRLIESYDGPESLEGIARLSNPGEMIAGNHERSRLVARL